MKIITYIEYRISKVISRGKFEHSHRPYVESLTHILEDPLGQRNDR